MDFSSGAFRAPPLTAQVSSDTVSHANLVMACRWGWTSSPGPNAEKQMVAAPSPSQQTPNSSFNNVRSKRFAPCQGRLYHQLVCSHRIRTDLVEDCGTNCVEPFGSEVGLTFICHECAQSEASKIWEERENQHNASWPPIAEMTQEQYDQWYAERRQLETEYARDRQMYEMEMKMKTRPSNKCSALEASKEDKEFASELDSLSLSMAASNSNTTPQHQQNRPRLSLPNDASEQLHWNLDALALDRGSCGVEYTSPQANNSIPTIRQLSDDDLWRKPHDED